jgi:nitrate/nitrite transport system ATP-binding protein
MSTRVGKRPLLELRGVEKRFAGRAEPTLRDVRLDVEEGELAVVVGCSGAGKTTLVSLIAGLVEADRGEIVFDGHPVCGPGPERAVVFQSYSLLPWYSVLDNVLLAVRAAAPELTRTASIGRATEFLELVRLEHALQKKPHALSGGMRQRVALARALAMKPRLLLLDEPLSALDALTRAALQDELARLCETTRTTAILVTNDIDEAILLGDRVHPLVGGAGRSLGESVPIDLGRPRVRTRLSLAPGYQRARRAIVAALVDARSAPGRPMDERVAG